MSEVVFSLGERTFPPDQPVASIFAFCSLMATVVAKRRGGKNSDYIAECADFMNDVVGRRLLTSDPLPANYDWRPAAAVECAEAMMEYDNG
jgi:hypothetical protein